MGCHFHPLGFMFHNSFTHTFQHHHFMFSFVVLLQHLWSSNYSSTTSMPLWIPWWSKCSTLILCIVLNHKVDIKVSILLLSSSNVGCHGITPRFSHVCDSTNVCKYIIMSLLIMYSLTFMETLLFDVQLDQKYLVEFQWFALKGIIRFPFQILLSICYKCTKTFEFFLMCEWGLRFMKGAVQNTMI
jgi:hypothetical protein